MPYKEKEIPRLFYSLTDVCEMFDVNASLIRFWEKEFEVLTPAKNKHGNRFFTAEDVQTFKQIYHLVKEKGYTLEGAKKVLKEKRGDLQNSLDMHNSLLRIRNFLTELKGQL